MLNAFKFGFWTGLRQWKITAIVYFFQLCLALTLGLQVLAVFESSIGNSLEINNLLQNYDYTVISDFLKIHGASITPLIGQLRWLMLIYVLFAVFIDGGLLACAEKSVQTNTQTFWEGGATYFFPFLKIFGFFLLLVLVWSALILMPIATFLQPALVYFPSEKYVVWGILTLLLLYFLGLVFLLIWSVLSRLDKIKNNNSIFASIKNGWQVFRANKHALWGILGLFFCLQATLIGFYWTLEAFLGMTSPFLIFFMAFIQQIFAFFRIMMRQMLYLGMKVI
jgi:hypothetical protein